MNKINNWGRLLFCGLSIVWLNQIAAQDSTKKDFAIKFHTTLTGNQLFEGTTPSVRMPENIRYRRSIITNAITSFNEGTDNPIRHGAYFGAFKTTSTYKELFVLKLDLFAEHRGVSYGSFNTENMIVYPVINVTVTDSLKLGNKNFQVKGQAGHFLDERLDEGLVIYNMDAQGMKLEINRGKWFFSYSLLGDFYNGIGLNIDDHHRLAICHTINQKTSIGAALYTMASPYSKRSDHLVISGFGKIKTGLGDFYLQAGYRPQTINGNASNNLIDYSGLLIGWHSQLNGTHIEISNNAEFRFYGKSFTEGYTDNRVRYRDTLNNSQLYANTIGKYLYPLRKYESPFSQFAVFTEYQSMNVTGLALWGSVKYKFSKFMFQLDYDVNQFFGWQGSIILI